VFDGHNLLDQDIGFGRVVNFIEIGRNPLLKIFGFAHVQNLPFFVVILVHSRIVWQGLNLK
jgi:hypothetical protein